MTSKDSFADARHPTTIDVYQDHYTPHLARLGGAVFAAVDRGVAIDGAGSGYRLSLSIINQVYI